MKTCPKCNEKCEDQFDTCWSCGADLPAGKATPRKQSIETKKSDGVRSNATAYAGTEVAAALIHRYTDAYSAARWLISIGSFVKWIAVTAAVICVVVGVVMAQTDGYFGYLVAGAAFAFGTPTFVLGILISGQGQTHLATLDMAVNTSRHLSDDAVAEIVLG